MARYTVPVEVRARIKEMHLSGCDTRKISESVGLHRTSINRILSMEGIRVRRLFNKIDAYRDDLISLHGQGLSVQLISERLSIAKSTALDWLRRLGLVPDAEERTDGLDMSDEESRMVDLTAEVYRLSGYMNDAGQIAEAVGEDVDTVQKIIDGKPDWWHTDDHDERMNEYWNPKFRTNVAAGDCQ